jgi:hypothetical protein
MKKLKYMLLLVAMAASFSSCVVRQRGGVYVRGHYENGPYGSHWVPGHYAQYIISKAFQRHIL